MKLAAGPDLAALAREEYERRLARAQNARRAGSMSAARATELLAPWAALLLRLEPDLQKLVVDGPLSMLSDPLDELLDCELGRIEPRIAAEALADDLCPRSRMLSTIAQARDVALQRAEGRSTEHGPRGALMRLVTLAVALGCPPVDPAIFAGSADHEERIAA